MLRRSFLLLAGAAGGGSSAGIAKPSHLYEMRIYDVIPQYYDTFHRLSMENVPKFPGSGKCMGYWTVQVGKLNQFVSIWQYDNLKHRYDVQKKIDADKEWQRIYTKEREKLIDRQESVLMRMIYREGNASTMSYKYLMQFSPEKEVDLSGPSAILAATFQVIVGESEGRYVHLIKAKNLDDVIPVRPVEHGSSKILGPARWSTAVGCTWR